MSGTKRPAKDAAHWLGPGHLWLDHVKLTTEDLEWMSGVRRLAASAVKHPAGFYAKLPELEWLHVDGGSAKSADFVSGCHKLRCLGLNQILGLSDLTAVASLEDLEVLSIYGQPRVESLPDLGGLVRLGRLELGSLKGLVDGLGPALRAPNLEELLLIRAVAVSDEDGQLINGHPNLRAFDWYTEDLPRRAVEPLLGQINKPKPRTEGPGGWFAERALNATTSANDVAALPESLRSISVQEPDGRVWWTLSLATQAVTELAVNGAVVLSLEVGDQPTSAHPGQFWTYGSGIGRADIEPALKQAHDALKHHPALSVHDSPWVRVTWARPT